MNSFFLTTNFKGDYFEKESSSRLRQGGWNQYPQVDGFNWNKKRVHWCINDKLAGLRMVLRECKSYGLLLQPQKSTRVALFGRNDIFVSLWVLTWLPLLIYNKHRKDSSHQEDCELLKPFPPYSETENHTNTVMETDLVPSPFLDKQTQGLLVSYYFSLLFSQSTADSLVFWLQMLTWHLSNSNDDPEQTLFWPKDVPKP